MTDVALFWPATGRATLTEAAKLGRVGRNTSATCPPVRAQRGQMDRRYWSGAGLGPLAQRPSIPGSCSILSDTQLASQLESPHRVVTPTLGLWHDYLHLTFTYSRRSDSGKKKKMFMLDGKNTVAWHVISQSLLAFGRTCSDENLQAFHSLEHFPLFKKKIHENEKGCWCEEDKGR